MTRLATIVAKMFRPLFGLPRVLTAEEMTQALEAGIADVREKLEQKYEEAIAEQYAARDRYNAAIKKASHERTRLQPKPAAGRNHRRDTERYSGSTIGCTVSTVASSPVPWHNSQAI